MRAVRVLGAVGAILALSACRSNSQFDFTPDAASEVDGVERRTDELRTLAGLSSIEQAVKDYIRTEGKIPARIDDLIPKYIPEAPTVELGIRAHRNTKRVRYYSDDILRDGRIDGSQLKDTGDWGYVRSERQVVVFVDCTHFSTDGRSWYLETGAL